MWRRLWPDRAVDDVPIGHVTNGVHLPTWLGDPMRDAARPPPRRGLDGPRRRTRRPGTRVDDIPDDASCGPSRRAAARRARSSYVRERSVADRLGRDEPRDYVEAAATLRPRRADDRLRAPPGHLQAPAPAAAATPSARSSPARRGDRPSSSCSPARRTRATTTASAARAGACSPRKGIPEIGAPRRLPRRLRPRASARALVRGCDVWVNLPRPPLEASGTSGMKSAVNGGLQLSVLDGWWAEGYDGSNGWALSRRRRRRPRRAGRPRRRGALPPARRRGRPAPSTTATSAACRRAWLRDDARLAAHQRAGVLGDADAARLRRADLRLIVASAGGMVWPMRNRLSGS